MLKPQTIAVKWGCNSTPTRFAQGGCDLKSEKWVIIGDDGLQLAQCLFEGTSIKITTLPTLSVVGDVAAIRTPITFPTEIQAEALASILRWTTIETFKNAKAVPL